MLDIKIISSINEKGGVGKSTTSEVLAEYFAIVKEKRVLFIDLDGQCNGSESLIGMDPDATAHGGKVPPKLSERCPDMYDPESEVEDRCSIADIFFGLPVLPYPSWVNKENGYKGNIDVFCGHPQKLAEINKAFDVNSLEKNVYNHLRSFLHDPEVWEYYDVVIIDTSPTDTPLFRAALRASTHIYIPLTPNPKDVEGLRGMLQHFKQENFNRTNDMERLELIGMLPNMVRSTRAQASVLNDFLEKYSTFTFPQEAWLSLLTAFPERDFKEARPKSIFELPKNHKARMQATAMGGYIHSKTFSDNLEMTKLTNEETA